MSPICTVATSLGWKETWLGLQHAVHGALGSWCVTTEGAELSIYVIEACFWIIDFSSVLHYFKCPERPLYFFLVEKV